MIQEAKKLIMHDSLFFSIPVSLFLPSSSTLLYVSPPLLVAVFAFPSSLFGVTSVASPVGGAPSNKLLLLPPLLLFLSSSEWFQCGSAVNAFHMNFV